MDDFFQIRSVGPPEREMLEAYTTLGYLAACTSRAKLLTLVTGAVYRYPGVLGKIVTTLDVLSGGRAWLGIGAAWNEEESRGLGIPFPPLAERFERLEETLQICLQMWRGDESRTTASTTELERPLNSPQSLTRPHPPIMIGGGGEKKTLRFVAKYADACNLFPSPELARKLDVLRAHCDAEGRDYDEITKTCYFLFDVGEKGEKAGEIVDRLGRLAELGLPGGDRRRGQRVAGHPARGDRRRHHPRRRRSLIPERTGFLPGPPASGRWLARFWLAWSTAAALRSSPRRPARPPRPGCRSRGGSG